MEGKGKKKGKKFRPVDLAQLGGDSSDQPQHRQPEEKKQQQQDSQKQPQQQQQQPPEVEMQPAQQGRGGPKKGGQQQQQKKQQQQQHGGGAGDGPPQQQGQGQGGKQQKQQQQQHGQGQGQQQQQPPEQQQGQQPKLSYRQRQKLQQEQQPQQPQQQQQQQQPQRHQQQQHQQQQHPQQQQHQQQPQRHQQQQQQPQHQQRQQQHQQQQQRQQQHQQQQRPAQPQQQQQQKPAHSPSPSSSSHSTSPSHAAALQRVDDDFSRMKIDKQKIQSGQLLPVLQRANAYGTRGREIKLEVNYIQLLLDRLVSTAFHYDVDIKPPASRKWQRSAFAAFNKQVFPNHRFAFDGHKNAYTAKRLKGDHYEQEVTVREDGRDRKFTVAMKEAAVLDMSCLKTYMNNGGTMDKPMSAIQCLDIVLRTAYEHNENFIKFKKSIYVVPDRPEDIGANHELWYGLFQSALLGSKPFLNIDVSHKAFPSGGPVLKILGDIIRGPVPDTVQDWALKELHDYLKGMELSYSGPGGASKIFKYNSLKGPASKQTFKQQDGTTLTVEQYFRQQNMPLRYPNLPVMHVGSMVRNIMLPMELCTVPRGQALTKKHPDSCTQMIIRRSATDTGTRKSKIMNLFNKIGYNNAPTIQEFGVSVGTQFEPVTGRLIDPPELLYRDKKTVKPQRGVWRADNLNFIVPSTSVTQRALKWTILNLDFRTRPDAIEQFGRSIYAMSQKQGVQLEAFSMKTNFYEPRDMRNCIRDLDKILQDLKSQKMDLVFVVIPAPGRDGDVYAKVKQKAELFVGLLTQCIKSFTLDKKRGDPSTISNIWLKINAKTNGTNQYLAPNFKPPMVRKRVMYIGADVTHPSPEQTNIPSVVGVAASYDMEGFRYNCCYRLQNAKDEMIRDLENIVSKQLRQFKQQNQALPELIMYYRDGVSEGQFSEILTIELRAIQQAANGVQQGYKPNVTFIVVQKRHHARFFPTGNCPTEGRNNNVMPGTIVDRHITTPNQYQFFLVSHAAVQGVAKPTKYCVLYDDENCHPDQLQALTYYLCHLFARCNRAVSYPAPTYYAHLAAYRGRVYIKDRNLNMDNLLNEYQRLQIKTEIVDGHPMFFV